MNHSEFIPILEFRINEGYFITSIRRDEVEDYENSIKYGYYTRKIIKINCDDDSFYKLIIKNVGKRPRTEIIMKEIKRPSLMKYVSANINNADAILVIKYDSYGELDFMHPEDPLYLEITRT